MESGGEGMGAGPVSDSADVDAVIADLNARMLASLLMLQFLEEFDKATADTPGPADGTVSALKPKVRVRFGGGIKSITVTVPGDTPAT